MKLSIELHLSSLSLSNIVRVCEIFAIKHARSTEHNWVHKPVYCPNPKRIRITWRLMRWWSDSMMSCIGCVLRSIQKQRIAAYKPRINSKYCYRSNISRWGRRETRRFWSSVSRW